MFGNLPPGVALLTLAIGLCTHNTGILATGLVDTVLATAWIMLLLYVAVSGTA
jgi:hypothetical protein